MKPIILLVKQYPLAAFFSLTFILSIGVGAITDAIWEATNSIVLTLPIALLSTGPLVSALVVSAIIGGKAAVGALLRKLTRWRVGWRWWGVALLLLPALALTAIYLNALIGGPAPTAAAFGSLSALLGAFALRLVNPFDGPMMEELGWRGFAQPRFQKVYSPLTANLILGLLVAIWHFQYIPSGQYSWIFIPATMASTILYGWVYNATGGSVLLTLIMHATEPLLWVTDEPRAMLIRVVIYVITAGVVVLLTGKNLGRQERPMAPTEPSYTPAVSV